MELVSSPWTMTTIFRVEVRVMGSVSSPIDTQVILSQVQYVELRFMCAVRVRMKVDR